MPSAGQVSIGRIMILIAVVAVVLAVSMEIASGTAGLLVTLAVLGLCLGTSWKHWLLALDTGRGVEESRACSSLKDPGWRSGKALRIRGYRET
jgi:hypothetical protein